MDNELNDIAKSLPLGIHYYIIGPKDKVVDGPWCKEEIFRRFAKCTVEGAAIAYWEDQKWVRLWVRLWESEKSSMVVRPL